MPSRKEPMPEKPAQFILRAVEAHPRELGIGTLALVLKGSKSQRVFNRQFYTSPFFGALLYNPLDVIENFVKQLVRQGLLVAINIGATYPIPLLEITPAGKKALEEKLDIPLQTVRTVKQPAINDTLQQTLDLYKQLKNIPEVAKQRQLAESTIWDHLQTTIHLKLLKPEDVVEPQKVELILKTQATLKTRRLKELKEALPEDITYEEIKCALARNERTGDSF